MVATVRAVRPVCKTSRYGSCFAGPVTQGRSLSTTSEVIREGDIVLLRRLRKPPFLTKPLKHGESIGTHFGSLKHDDIIGKSYRDTVRSSTQKYARIHRPELGEYVALTPRLVTPVYPADANLITSLLDIHVTPPSRDEVDGESGPPLEILEAGTGHGALTLHLARAIHAANSPRPPMKPVEDLKPVSSKSEFLDVEKQLTMNEASDVVDPLAAWRKRRRAIIHTVEAVGEHSRHAEKIVQGFRQGIYAGNVDFHVGDVATFITEECQRRGVSGKIFHHILLDLPGTHEYIVKAAQALIPDGTLVVFSPSITQIAQCVKVIRRLKLPLSYDQVIELGAGYGGGKQWDVRLARAKKARATSDKKQTQDPMSDFREKPRQEPVQASGLLASITRFFGFGAKQPPAVDKSRDVKEDVVWHMVCRPSVGHKVIGGGFVGVWRRKKDWEQFDEEEGED